MFRITNQYNTIIWKGEAGSFKEAWDKMFNQCSYPMGEERSICKQIELGLWIERLDNCKD